MPHSEISSTHLPPGQGRRARHRALWNDSTPETWARVIGAYMLICGIAGLADVIAQPAVNGEIPLAWLWRTFPWDSAHWLSYLMDRFEYATRTAVFFVLPVVAVVLLRRSRALVATLFIVWPLVSLRCVFSVSRSVAGWFTGNNSMNAMIEYSIWDLWDCARPLCALWAARRVCSG